jgi:hypothetical protein
MLDEPKIAPLAREPLLALGYEKQKGQVAWHYLQFSEPDLSRG